MSDKNPLWVIVRFLYGWLIAFPILLIAAIISNRVDGAPDHYGRDNRAFKWLPWGRKAKN